MPEVNANVKAAIDELFSTSPDARDDLYRIGQYCDELVESLDDLDDLDDDPDFDVRED